ncbi:MAG: hypothetical protein ACYDBP_09935 [Leptospirales bacterium]
MDTKAILGRIGGGVKGWTIPFMLSAALLVGAGCASNAPGEGAVSVDDQPTPIRFEGQSTPVLLPRTNLYIFLTSSRPLYLRDGVYYQYYQDQWYRSEDLKGPWEAIEGDKIPDLLQNLPPDYYYDNFPYKLRKDH